MIDVDVTLARARHRRELAKVREENRKRLRFLLLVPFVIGVAVLTWAVVSFDPPDVQLIKVLAGVVLTVPFLATFGD